MGQALIEISWGRIPAAPCAVEEQHTGMLMAGLPDCACLKYFTGTKQTTGIKSNKKPACSIRVQLVP